MIVTGTYHWCVSHISDYQTAWAYICGHKTALVFGQYWNFLFAIIVKRWPCDSCEYCDVRFTSQLIDIIGVKWDSDMHLKQKLIFLLSIYLYLMVYCLCKALIVQSFSCKLFKSAILLQTQYCGSSKIAAVLSVAHYSISVILKYCPTLNWTYTILVIATIDKYYSSMRSQSNKMSS